MLFRLGGLPRRRIGLLWSQDCINTYLYCQRHTIAYHDPLCIMNLRLSNLWSS